MSNPIIPKRSSVAGKVPLATDLQVGEIAVNLADGLIFTKNAGGTVIGLGGGSGSYLPLTGGTVTGDTTFSAALGVGTSALGGHAVRISKSITGTTLAKGVRVDGAIQSDVTTNATGYDSAMSTAATAFTLPLVTSFRAQGTTVGSGSTLTEAHGFEVNANFTTAANNYGFYGGVPAGTGRWNLYMNGTADNYVAGKFIHGSAIGLGSAASPNYGTSGQVLKSAGSGAVPTWSSLTLSDVTTALSFTPVSDLNGTASTLTLNSGSIEEVFSVTGTTPAISPADGSIQTWTLTANSTPLAGTWVDGQSITLMIDDGASYTITWTSMAIAWKSDSGAAPTLNATGYTVVQLWKVGGVLYGVRVGNA